MANIEDALKEYEVVHEPEEAVEPPSASATSQADRQETEEASQVDNTYADVKVSDKKSAFRDSHPVVDIICPRVNCSEKIVRVLSAFSCVRNTLYDLTRCQPTLVCCTFCSL
jgi:hypothetical protein